MRLTKKHPQGRKDYKPMQMIVIDIESTEVLCASFDGETNEQDGYTPDGIEGIDRSEEFQFP